ncbi:MAG TPA: hypothetical protein PKI61_01715 [bacterium]|nr:hypothetical protein [bacterium]HPT30154.1 hypothetical protein [bacterium]
MDISKLTVILIEDNPDYILLITREVHKMGCGLFLLSNLEDVRAGLIKSLSLSESGRYIILLDGSIPEANGESAPKVVNTQEAIQIAKDWEFAGPIIAISDNPQSNEALFLAGATHRAKKEAKPLMALVAELAKLI